MPDVVHYLQIPPRDGRASRQGGHLTASHRDEIHQAVAQAKQASASMINALELSLDELAEALLEMPADSGRHLSRDLVAVRASLAETRRRLRDLDAPAAEGSRRPGVSPAAREQSIA
ncbi:MAG: hypothetical protein J0H01_12035 [Rhizobiales bacterium]|nr:hypothetical protein [Hyphomicrobiales bacterium]